MSYKKIKKRSKGYEDFDLKKYKESLLKSGLHEHETAPIIAGIGDIRNYFSTSELSKKTYNLILKQSKTYAANYNLIKALYSLGPTGYPFEILCSELLKAKGYTTRIGVNLKGEFVTHEVDVIAERDDDVIYCECKFHARKTHKNDIKIPLYVHSRYLDLKSIRPNLAFSYALMSNTYFSVDAITYADGVGLKLYSLNDPRSISLLEMIKNYKIYPLTTLRSLKVSSKRKLLDSGVVTIKQITEKDLSKIGLDPKEITKVLQEVRILTRPT